MAYAAGEIVLIVVGILLALQISEWNQDWKDKETETDHLRALRGEFEANLQELERIMGLLKTRKGDAEKLLTIMVGDEEMPSHERVTEMVWEAFSFEMYSPMTSTYDNLISTGEIALLRDEGLKTDLGLFKSKLDQYRVQEWQMDQWKHVIQPFVGREMAPLDFAPQHWRKLGGLPDPITFNDWDSLLKYREFEAILLNRVMASSDNLLFLNKVLPPTQRIVDRLSQSSGED